MTVKISPSLLSADFGCLKDEVIALEKAKADCLHFDIMDNHYVPNLTFGATIIQALRPHTTLPFEAHLMVTRVDSLIPVIAHAGADVIIIHPETTLHLHRSLMLIKSFNKKAGIALNPTSSLECLTYMINVIDYILVMSVNPGFGNQTFIESQFQKIEDIKILIKNRNIQLAVDGGINQDTAKTCRNLGADVLIAGQAIFKNKDYVTNIADLR